MFEIDKTILINSHSVLFDTYGKNKDDNIHKSEVL